MKVCTKKRPPKTVAQLVKRRLFNVHTFPLNSGAVTFLPGAEVDGIDAKVLESWERRGVVAELRGKRVIPNKEIEVKK